MNIRHFRELNVCKIAKKCALQIYELSKSFPVEEKYSLTDQIRRSSRSVCANIAEAWRKRRYEKAFVAKLSDSDSEAAETQVWLEFAFEHKYLDKKTFNELDKKYDHIMGMLVKMIDNSKDWIIK